jgi:hypothetical protein
MHLKTNSICRFVIALGLSFNFLFPIQVRAQGLSEFPLVRGPGVSQEQLEAFAEAQGRLTLSDHLDMIRPGKDPDQRIHKLIERAQIAWLSGSVEAARSLFKEIGHQALDADWREPQREAIHYAFLRLAQSAPTPTERDEWIERAVTVFPDLQADSDTFPPPLIETFRATRSRVLALAKTYVPLDHFPDHRYLLINGKRFAINADLKIRLPQGTHRVTALSDAYLPVTEKLTSSQMQVFRLSMPLLASGTCSAPNAGASNAATESITVVYSTDCVRSKTVQGWLAPENVGANLDEKHAKVQSQPFDSESFSATGESTVTSNMTATSSKKQARIWAGVAAVAAGSVYIIQKQMIHHSAAQTSPQPVQRTGF